jgi:hypothetical protein
VGSTLAVHVAAGALGLLLATVALVAAKGGRLHRKAGLLFVAAMLVMATTGMALALAEGPDANALGGLSAAYLVVTALTTVRPRSPALRRVDAGAMVVGLALGVIALVLGVVSINRPGAHVDGVPAPILFTFAAVGLLGSAGDLRATRSGGLTGARRLARHLWRMCFALWIATASFFLGQADEIPEPLRILPLLAALAFAPLVVLVHWLWRVRFRQGPRGVVGLGAGERG